MVSIPGIGKVRAEALEKAGITTKFQFINPKNREACMRAIGEKTYEKTLKRALN